MKRVVISGLGVVSCLGNNQDEVYKSLLNAKSGISFSEEYKEYNLKSNVHGKPNIKLVLRDLTHITDTQTKYLSTILTFDFASVCLATLIITGKLLCHPSLKMLSGAFRFSKINMLHRVQENVVV